jgi:hypothetical protein
MNVFFISRDPAECARWHVDRHVVKMVVEYAQLLASAHRMLDMDFIDPSIYKLSHKNHPCAVWCRQTSGNYQWLFDLYKETALEYTHRYGKHHASWTKCQTALSVHPRALPIGAFTDPPPCVGPELKARMVEENLDSLEINRIFYSTAKQHLHSWKQRSAPDWITQKEKVT